MKPLEQKLIAELMKNSRTSDRDLAKTLGVSQPTITRTRNKLEKEGIIKEYTLVPDFSKLGFQILSIIFAKLKPDSSTENLETIRNRIIELDKQNPIPSIMGMSGMGLDSDRAIIILHQSFTDYIKFIESLRKHPLIDVVRIKSFTIDLTDTHLQPLSFSNIARYLLKEAEKREQNPT